MARSSAARSATADVGQFAEAIDYFRGRLPVTTGQLEQLGKAYRDRAFWITGVAQLDVVVDVYNSIFDALKKGTSLTDWKEGIEGKLTKAWGKADPWRVEVIFRNATQQAFVAGRIAQLREPEVLRLRPYWKYIAADDGRCTSGICPACKGLILPADDPWWQTRTPPRHMACRCHVEGLRRSVAEKQGITKDPPPAPSAEGFGRPPDQATLEELQQTMRRRIEQTSPELVQEFERKQEVDKSRPEAEPAKAAEPKANPDHEPKRWQPYFVHQGYEPLAAKALAHGRAMVERGLDMTLADVEKTLQPLVELETPDQHVHGWAIRKMRALGTGQDRLRSLLEKHSRSEPLLKGLAAMAAHVQSLGARGLDASFGVSRDVGEASLKNAKQAAGFYAVMGASTYSFHNVDIEIDSPNATWNQGRAYYDQAGTANYNHKKNWISGGKRGDAVTLVHELGHCLEAMNRRAASRALSYYRSRTKGEPLERLRDITKNEGFGPREKTRRDKFFDPYMGKEYPDRLTELTSMTIERLLGSWAHVLEHDPDSFYFALGQLADAG